MWFVASFTNFYTNNRFYYELRIKFRRKFQLVNKTAQRFQDKMSLSIRGSREQKLGEIPVGNYC